MAGSLGRPGSKHSPRRRITFPSILPLFSPPAHPRSSPLEPVQEGKQLRSRAPIPSEQRTQVLVLAGLGRIKWTSAVSKTACCNVHSVQSKVTPSSKVDGVLG